MELKELVEQIAVKVAERISELEESTQTEICGGGSGQKPKLLILTEDHGTACHELLEKEAVKAKFEVVCTRSSEYTCDLQQIDTIVLGSFSSLSLGKIAEGIGDTPFTETVIKAILMGKQILIPHEEMEIYQYRNTAPKLYYGLMMQKIEFLKSAGIRFCSRDQLESMILENEGTAERKSCEKPEEKLEAYGAYTGNSIKFTKKIITERDLRAAYEQHAMQVFITKKTIITDLAREYAEQKGISFAID
ncbi:hypothetical protein [Aminipila luticellarii]|uniref:Ethanolamine utilization protein n=1 Tax=Aminipila luticellarii TaxID=2507160 RepID=A0A410PXT9_9FIRM|nr:hypothetical protein [Aminipila luticellarii]QAT43771.1 hypothetical protein EQM06_11355 [Aminipila luticellarii]